MTSTGPALTTSVVVPTMGKMSNDDSLAARPVLSALAAIKDSVDGLRADTNERFVETNERLDQTNERLERTNERLDLVAERQLRTATEVVELTGEVRVMRQRFEHFVATEGDVIRDLKARMSRCENALGLQDDPH